MNAQAYKKFFEQMTKIRKDCCVSNDVAKQDSSRYTTYTLQFPYSRNAQVSYDKEKLKKYEADFRQMFSEIPQGKVGSIYIVSGMALINENVKKEPDVTKRMRTITQQHNLAELFLRMSVDFGILNSVGSKPENPNNVYGIMSERIRSHYDDGSR